MCKTLHVFILSVWVIVLSTNSSYGAPQDNLRGFSFDGFNPKIGYSLIAPNADEVIPIRFGKPNSFKRDLGAIRLGSQSEHVYWEFDGLVIETSGFVKEEGRWLQEIVLTNDSISLVNGLSVGQHKDLFLEVLGPVFHSTEHMLLYRTEYYQGYGGAGFIVYIDVELYINRENIVKKIVWKYLGD